MAATKAVAKHDQQRSPTPTREMPQGRTYEQRQPEHVPESSPPLHRYLGNSYVQAITTTGGETLQVPAVSPIVHSAPLRPSQSGILRRKCACGGAADMSGECEECAKKERLRLQTKLKINEPGDIYEQEADRVAAQVLATPAHIGASGAVTRIQGFSGQSNGQMEAAPASVDQPLVSPGRLLEPALRQDMELRFGHDFSRVRVPSGAAAEQSAQDVNAHAYTVGHDMVFGAGGFAPGTHEGRRLLAHELTHVVQQAGADWIYADPGNEKRGLSGLSPHVPQLVHVAQQGAGSPVGAAPLQRQVKPGGGLSNQQLEQIARQLYEALSSPLRFGFGRKDWFEHSIFSALSGTPSATP
jgi:Domain of unknown function (DUF4157)